MIPVLGEPYELAVPLRRPDVNAARSRCIRFTNGSCERRTSVLFSIFLHHRESRRSDRNDGVQRTFKILTREVNVYDVKLFVTLAVRFIAFVPLVFRFVNK